MYYLINNTLNSNCVYAYTFGYMYTFRAYRTVYNDTHVEFDEDQSNNSSIALYHPPLSIHKVIHNIIMLL